MDAGLYDPSNGLYTGVMFIFATFISAVENSPGAEYSVHVGRGGRPDDTETRVSNFATAIIALREQDIPPRIFINKVSLLSAEGPFIWRDGGTVAGCTHVRRL